MLKTAKKVNGFSLVEVIVVIAVIGSLLAISAPVYRGVQTRYDFDLALDVVRIATARAQVLSQGASHDSSWGVSFFSNKAIVFKGSSFSGRDQGFDEIYSIPAGLSLSGTTELSFIKNSGFLPTSSTLILSNSSRTKTLTINTKGVFNY